MEKRGFFGREVCQNNRNHNDKFNSSSEAHVYGYEDHIKSISLNIDFYHSPTIQEAPLWKTRIKIMHEAHIMKNFPKLSDYS